MTATEVSRIDRTVAIIPVRGGSKGIPGKNLERVGGASLVSRAVRAARSARGIDEVVVSTDSPAIAEEAAAEGARVVTRPTELATDTARSEDALLHVLELLDADATPVSIVAFVQATSPFIDVAALEEAIATVRSGRAQVAFSVARTDAFLWARSEAGAVAINHDASSRPRRQDREPQFRETGAFYVLDAAGFREAGFRFFGELSLVEVPETTSIEIDTFAELDVARAMASSVSPRASEVPARALVTDFDGVHTDDTVAVDQSGIESVRVSRSDGLGIARLRGAGVPILILSSEPNAVVAARAAKLGVEVRHGVVDKLAALEDWCAQRRLDLRDVAYVGNDVNDLDCLKAVGWPVVPANARPEVALAARVRLTSSGGQGAVREIAELILASSEGAQSPPRS